MPNRTLCDVLKEMRKCQETHNYSYLPSLIEEAQHMGNRMEAALYDKKDLEHYQREVKKLKKEIKTLKEEKEKLGGEEDEPSGLFGSCD